MLTQVINSLAPVFLIIGLGAVLRAKHFLSEDFFRDMNRLVFWVGLPLLLFHKIATAKTGTGPAMQVFWALLIATACCVVVGYLGAWLLGLPSRAKGSFVQAVFRGNLVYAGLPVILYALSSDTGPSTRAIEALAFVAIAPLVPIYNVLSVIVLVMHSSGGARPSIKTLAWNTFTNPLFVSCVLGILYSAVGWNLPVLAKRTCAAVGQMALPLALLSIGASLRLDRVRGDLLPAVCAAILKIGFAPVAGYLAARQLGLSAEHTRIVLIYLAAPTAAVSYIMAQQLGGDESLSGSVVVISTLLALISLSVVIVV